MIDARLRSVRMFWTLVAALIVSALSWQSEANAQLKLSEAVAQALEKNPEIQSLRERLQVANARAKQAPYLEDPEIAFQLGGVPFSTPTNLNRADTNSIGIRQKLPFFGKLGLKEKIAVQEAKVAEQELRAKEREIVAKVKMTYADLFMAQKSIEILREQSDILRTLIRATEARYQVGRVTQQDVFKALLELSDLQNQLIVAEAERSTNELRVNALMNRSLQITITVPEELTVPEPTLTPTGLTDLALANRPELKGAQEDIERTERMHELAERNRKFPDFMVGWDYWRKPTDDMAKDRYAGMVNITIPFSPWTIGRRDHEIEETLAENRAAKANRDAIKVMTLRELGESQAKVEAARRSVTLYREGLLSQAELSFRASLAAYQAGRVEFVSLVEAQRALRDARMGYFRTLVGLMQNLADMERAVGRDLP
jgi:outer membrane protein, heavy metal efflux system